MHATPARTGGVDTIVLATTMGFALLGSLASGFMSYCEPFLVLGLMLLIGLPHGATDHGLFLALTRGKKSDKKISFYLAYALVIGAYGLVWLTLPLLAFGLFMLMSVYHFGQSNWADVDHGNAWGSRAHYLLWGCGVLLTPILLHGGEAATIVASMTDSLFVMPNSLSVYVVVGALGVANFIALVYWWRSGVIDQKRFFREVLGYAVLMVMFFTNSLLLGFTVYFVFWHSLASVKDQVRFFQRRLSPAVRRQLLLGILTTVGGAMVFCLIVWFGPGPEAALNPAIIGGVFVFISLLTLPHMLLVEQLYRQWSPVAETEKIAGLNALANEDLHTNPGRNNPIVRPEFH